jgi:indolepyruvate ferredoxin oxidoreductase alpha subunit
MGEQPRLPEETITGSVALARGALDAGVRFVTGYPGSPSTATVEALLRIAPPQVRIEWAINEKSAFDAAFGATLAGVRALLCLKSVGLNVALDSLMVGNLAGGDGGFVILAGDDPGGWGSQNEEDSRLLGAAAEVPVLEPQTAAEAQAVMAFAFDLAEVSRLPVVVRVTRGLTGERAPAGSWQPPDLVAAQGSFRRVPDRLTVLPVHVVAFHRAQQVALERVRTRFEASPWNRVEGQGARGVLAAGHMAHKLTRLLAGGTFPPLRVLSLSTLYPLPEAQVLGFLRQVEVALILEETAPFVEVQVQALAQRAGLAVPVLGRATGHVPGAGELFAPDLVAALRSLWPDWPWPEVEAAERTMPSRKPLCDGCPYEPALESLLVVMAHRGGRDAFVITGETGCMVRAQLPPWEILDVKYGMGSSIGLAAGLARAGIEQRIVALSGDSALLHSGLGELIDAVLGGVRILVVVLANQTTALSGGQPHPATPEDARGRARRAVDLAALCRAAGVEHLWMVDPEDRQATLAALEQGLAAEGVAVVIAERACPVWL